MKHNRRCLAECEGLTAPVTIYFYCVFFQCNEKRMVTAAVSLDILSITAFCFWLLTEERSHMGLEQHEGE